METEINVGFKIEIKQEGETFHCYIQSIDSYFFAKNTEDIQN
jgi:hypothetical protein